MLSTCPHCQQNTLATISDEADPRVHCLNRGCGGWYATRPLSEFMAFTAELLASFIRGRSDQNKADIEQAEFEAKLAEFEKTLAARAAARLANPNEKTFC